MSKPTPGAEKGMVTLEIGHPIIYDTIMDLFSEETKRESMDVKIADFDGVEYQLLVEPEKKDAALVSMKMRCAKDVMPMGAKAVLDQVFGKHLANTPQPGYDVTIAFNVSEIAGDERAKLAKACSELRYTVMGAPLERCFEALSKDGSGSLKPMIINYRPKEALYLHPLADRVLVFFSMDFFDDTDRAIAAIFLNELSEAQRKLQNAPAVTFTREPPGQLKSVPGFKETPNCVGYVMFTVFKLHVDKPEKIKNAAQLFVGFRAYMYYHIKAAKTQLQTRMRTRVESMLKVLNRANPEAAEAEKAAGRRNTTTNTTKTFRRF